MSFSWHSFARAVPSFNRTAAAGLFPLIFAGCTESATAPIDEGQEQILFLSTRDGVLDDLQRPLADVYRMNADGSGIVNLTNQPAHYNHLSLSPDGRRFAFSRAATIWVMDTDGTDPVQLTNQSGSNDDRGNGQPRWSPDGTQIAFATNREDRSIGDHSGLDDVYVMNADGSNARNVSHSLGAELGFNVYVLGWSPDGRIVFQTDTGAGADSRAYLVDADGTNLRPLLDGAGDHSPAWSPDGSKVAFISERDGRRRLYIMNADGSGIQPLTAHPGHDRLPMGPFTFTNTAFEYNPWSPDGTRIAFERFHDIGDWGTIHVIRVDGSDLQRLTDHSSIFNGWSPSGSQIAYTMWVPDTPRDVYVVNADGSSLRNLTNSASADTDALWLLPR